MGDVVWRRIFISLTTVFGMTLLMAVLLYISQRNEQNKRADINTLRLDAGELVSCIENSGCYDIDSKLPYAVIQNDGSVVFNRGTSLHDRVNLHSIGTDSNGIYTVPLLDEGIQYAILYVEIPQSYYGMSIMEKLTWILTAAVIIMVAAVGYIILLSTLKKDIFVPVRQLHNATCDIMKGQLDTKVKYDYDGEIGMLCHDFELMRMELCDSVRREQKMKEEEKILTASISHDLKTPLATIRGYLESICLDVVTEREDIRQYCKSALDKTILLGNITNDILEHSKAELHQLTIQREEVYTAEYFKELVNTLRSDVKSRGFSLTCGEIPNLIVSLDRTRIAEVMENLIGNSLKYGKKGGHIEINFRTEADFFYICVKDDGQGIAAGDLPFVFDRFFRGDKARTQKIAGSGLGLSIAKYIVEGHGGRIECDSVLGCGTVIEFSIAC